MRRLSLLALLSLAACASSYDQMSLHERAVKTRQSMPACDGGNADACNEACLTGGPNRSCQRACDAGNAKACGLLADRLHHGIDVEDSEAQAQNIAPASPELVTGLYEQACRGGFGAACLPAGNRILNGEGRGSRPASVAVDLLKLGCTKYRQGIDCCSMSQLNARLADGNNVNTITDFRAEARKWAILAEREGAPCPAPEAQASAPLRRRAVVISASFSWLGGRVLGSAPTAREPLGARRNASTP